MNSDRVNVLSRQVAQHAKDGQMSVSCRIVGRDVPPGAGDIRVTGLGALDGPAGAAQLGSDATEDVFAALTASLPALVTREEARFVPDSVLGVLTLTVAGERTELFFMADEQQAKTAGTTVPPVLAALERAARTAQPQGNES